MIVLDRRVTPRLSDHARERCAEMGISTKRAKRVLQEAVVNRPAKGGILSVSDDPDIAVVWEPSEWDGVPFIFTVVWRTYETYDRATYSPGSN